MKTIKYCPQCKSSDIHVHMGGVLGMQNQCEKCGYLGTLVIERDEVEPKK